ncbi:MAG: ABC transporter ATP-binding protein NatA [Firmicutes bacterium]|nr:ABC transporter ATP-binding protein NatA [Bacillota bacterium]
MIQVTALSKRFGNRTAVNAISFQAHPGEIFGLLGENGAGKTTTLRMIATVLSPDDGDISVYGRSVRQDQHEVRRHLGFLTADAGLYNRLSAKENVEYFGQLWGIDRNTIRRRTTEIFAMLQLDNVGDRPVGTFSKGMKQKVCLARTFVHDPLALLLDEPCNGLDVSSANAVTDFMIREKQAGKTIIFSSHNMGEVEKLCNQVAIIHHGGLIAQGSVEALKGNYSARFEDTFLRLVGAKA